MIILQKKNTNVINNNKENYLSHFFISIPIYDIYNVQIGYKVSNTQYSVRINSTYHFFNNSSISWQYSFINNAPNYPLNISNSSNITSTTGEYFGKTGIVSLTAKEDGSRNVTIGFNF